MKIALFYFSGTGNTEKCVSFWKENASKHNIQIDLFKIEEDKFDFSTLDQYDKIGFGYPIHAFNQPENVWRYCKKFPKQAKEKPYFVIMCSGEYMTINNSSANKMNRILRHRNFKLESDYHYIMPYNMIFRHTEIRAYKMYETLTKLVPVDVYEYLVEGKPHFTKKHHCVGWFIWLLRIEQVFSWLIGITFRVNTKKCIKCMKCVNNCPTKNIEYVNGKFKFHTNCLVCTRCSFNCPVDAFNTGFLNSWRVNKPYAFKDPGVPEVDKHPKYCKKSYIRYFTEAEERISKFQTK